MILAVYGNFRQDEPLSYYLDYLRGHGKIVTTTIRGVRLYVFGQAPGAVLTNDESDYAIMEIIEANVSAKEEAKWLKLLDHVEGVETGLYERVLISTPVGMAHVYVCKLPAEGMPIITDWLEWKKRSKKEKMRAFRKLNAESVFVTL